MDGLAIGKDATGSKTDSKAVQRMMEPLVKTSARFCETDIVVEIMVVLVVVVVMMV